MKTPVRTNARLSPSTLPHSFVREHHRGSRILAADGPDPVGGESLGKFMRHRDPGLKFYARIGDPKVRSVYINFERDAGVNGTLHRDGFLIIASHQVRI